MGAGGVAPSIIVALKRLSAAKIILSNRTKEKAEDLKSQFHDLEILDWGDINDFDVIIKQLNMMVITCPKTTILCNRYMPSISPFFL